MTRSIVFEAALRYADLGYAVFPCAPGDSKPLTANGFHDASLDPAQIERWWTAHPSANIGLPTAGLLVVDIDSATNPWPGAERALELATGAMARTPRGGSHHLFRRPAGKAWRCTQSELAPQVDTRTDGGYIVVPPSRRPEGEYRWIPGLELDAPLDRLPEPPAWLVELVELAVRAMQYSSRAGENVLDLFGGSGSTLIAAQQTGRRTFLMELVPLYCDVIVQRYEKFAGKKAERISGKPKRQSPNQSEAAQVRKNSEIACLSAVPVATAIVRS